MRRIRIAGAMCDYCPQKAISRRALYRTITPNAFHDATVYVCADHSYLESGRTLEGMTKEEIRHDHRY